MTKLHVPVIIGSTREGRYGDKPATWIRDRLAKHPHIETELLDLRDYPLPMFELAVAPVRAKPGDYGHPVANQLAAKLAAADAYVMTVAEYNHGYTAVLKNALDWTYHEWNRKPVGFVGYGGVGGARAIEQLRMVAVELQMAPIKQAVHLGIEVLRATMKLPAPVDPALFEPAAASADGLIENLVWWGRTLRAGRADPG